MTEPGRGIYQRLMWAAECTVCRKDDDGECLLVFSTEAEARGTSGFLVEGDIALCWDCESDFERVIRRIVKGAA